MNKYLKLYFIVALLSLEFFNVALGTYLFLLWLPTKTLLDVLILGVSVSVILILLPAFMYIWLEDFFKVGDN